MVTGHFRYSRVLVNTLKLPLLCRCLNSANPMEQTPYKGKTFAQIIKKFPPPPYETQRHITLVTKDKNWSLSGASCIQSTSLKPIYIITNFNIIFFIRFRIRSNSLLFKYRDLKFILQISQFLSCVLNAPTISVSFVLSPKKKIDEL